MNPELVRKFFDGKCTPEEVHQVLIWINSEEGVSELAKNFGDFNEYNKDGSEISQAVLEKIHDRIAQEGDEQLASNPDNLRLLRDKKPGIGQFRNLKLGIAVSLLLTLMASTVWLFSVKREEKLSDEANLIQVEYITRQTVPGEKLTLKLNDGSIIHLNSTSKIRFPKIFEGTKREVFMEGQVFFDVHRDESKPFVVHSKDLVTSVLGTSFAIVEDSSSQISQVAVLTGKVKVAKASNSDSTGKEELYLEPMQAASLNMDNGSFDKIKVDYDKAFAWKDNVLVFQNVSFDQVLKKLENWYGVKFIQKRKIKGLKDYSGRFDNQTLEEIMIGLSFTYDFEFEIQKPQVIIK